MKRGMWVLLIGLGVLVIGAISFDFTIFLLGGFAAIVGIAMLIFGGAKAGISAGVKSATGDKTGSGTL